MAQWDPGHVWGLPAFTIKSIISKTNRRCLWVAVQSPAQIMFSNRVIQKSVQEFFGVLSFSFGLRFLCYCFL